MPRATRAHTGPGGHETDGFSVRQHTDTAGTLVAIAAAFGPDWFGTLTMIHHRLEQPYVKCHVTVDAPGLADNELLVRWATSAELQERRAYAEQRQAPLKALLRQQEAAQRAAQERQDLEAAGQSGLF
ncbi:hypothetical protein [Streptomyces longispororuber]|uniref:hypothetical protein n=1 Tax=Streptomyces longispororuber TaxID=68230 RepID=UPI0036FB27F3